METKGKFHMEVYRLLPSYDQNARAFQTAEHLKYMRLKEKRNKCRLRKSGHSLLQFQTHKFVLKKYLLKMIVCFSSLFNYNFFLSSIHIAQEKGFVFFKWVNCFFL